MHKLLIIIALLFSILLNLEAKDNVIFVLDFKNKTDDLKFLDRIDNTFIKQYKRDGTYSFSVYSRLLDTVIFTSKDNTSISKKKKGLKRHSIITYKTKKTNYRQLNIVNLLGRISEQDLGLIKDGYTNKLVLVSNMLHNDEQTGINFNVGYPTNSFIVHKPFNLIDGVFKNTISKTQIYVLYPYIYNGLQIKQKLEAFYGLFFNHYLGMMNYYSKLTDQTDLVSILRRDDVKYQEANTKFDINHIPNLISYNDKNNLLFTQVSYIYLQWSSRTKQSDLDLFIEIKTKDGIKILNFNKQILANQNANYTLSRDNARKIERLEISPNSAQFSLKENIVKIYVKNSSATKNVKAKVQYLDGMGNITILKDFYINQHETIKIPLPKESK